MERISNNFISSTITAAVANRGKRGKLSFAYTFNSIIVVGGIVIPVIVARKNIIYRVPGGFNFIFNRLLN